VYFRIGRCYRRTGVFDRALEYYGRVRNLPASPLAAGALFQTAFCQYLKGDYDSSLIVLRQDQTDPSMAGFQAPCGELRCVDLMMQGQWPEAREALGVITDRDPFTAELEDFLAAKDRLPRKNMALAGVYSAVVPGLGKLYCRRPLDALSSFTSIGILGWQAYDGFHDDGPGSVKGWIFSVIGGIFYLGNVYGSVVAADLYNEEGELMLIQKVQVRVNAYFD
jgi:tetratricopeptide (TPR) repeat protein